MATSTSKVSQSTTLLILATIFGTIFLAFGANFMTRPRQAFEVFEFGLPASEADRKLIDSLMVLYGAKDLFMGASIYSAAYLGTRKSLGWTCIAASGVALVDGLVCIHHVGHGQWNHWGYGGVLTMIGILLAGALD